MEDKKYFSKEQIETLKPAEIHFYSCVYEQWKRGTVSTMNDLVADTYEQTTGEQLPRNWNCASCSFNNYLKVGKLYYESIEYWKNIDEQKEGKQLEFDFNDEEPEKVEPEPAKVERTIDQVQDTSETTVPDSTHQVDEVVEVNDSDKVGNEIEPTLIINELKTEVAKTETNNTQEQPKKKPGRPKKNK